MRTNTQQQRTTSPAEDMGLGPKKTFLILFTVVGCIAILFPKIFYPMIVGPSQKDMTRGPPNLQKQERPPHLRDGMPHPGMLERGRAIPPHPTVPIIERPGRPGGLPPGNIERRPGGPMVPGQPGPNLRAAAYQAQQTQQKTGSTSIIMPIYTFGIVAFFVFTIVKIMLKKTNKAKTVPTIIEPDPKFAEKVFQQRKDESGKKLGWKDHNAIYTAIQGIIDATNDQLNEIERKCAEKNVEHSNHYSADKTSTDEQQGNESDENKNAAEIKLNEEHTMEEEKEDKEEVTKNDLLNHSDEVSTSKNEKINNVKSEHDLEVEKRLNLLKEAMHIRAVENIENSDLKSIYLEGELPDDPKILVSATETETKTEKISRYPSVKDVADDEAVILSGKMTISLISLANNSNSTNHKEEEKNGIVEDHTSTNNVA